MEITDNDISLIWQLCFNWRIFRRRLWLCRNLGGIRRGLFKRYYL